MTFLKLAFMKVLTLIKTLVVWFWFLFLILIGAQLVADNGQEITPMIIGVPFPSMSLGMYSCLFVFIGILLGFLSSFLVTQGRLLRKKRELVLRDKEVERLRVTQVQG